MGLQSGRASLPASRHVGRKLAAQQELRPPIVLPSPQRHCDPNAEPCRLRPGARVQVVDYGATLACFHAEPVG